MRNSRGRTTASCPRPGFRTLRRSTTSSTPVASPSANPGNTPWCRLVGDRQQHDEVWNEFQTELGRDPRPVGPEGAIQKIDVPGGYVQYRPWSDTGGSTIDVRVPGQPIRVIHIKGGRFSAALVR